MDDFLKWACAFASAAFVGFMSLCSTAVVNFFGADISTGWAYLAAGLAFLFTLWDCYKQ